MQVATNDIDIQTIVNSALKDSSSRDCWNGDKRRSRSPVFLVWAALRPSACRLFSSKEKDGESSMRMPSLYWGESELLQRQMTLGDNGAKLGHQLAYFARTLGRILTGTINGGGIRSLPPKATCSIILFSVHSHQPCVSADPDHHKHSPVIMFHNQTSQELRMLSSVTLNS